MATTLTSNIKKSVIYWTSLPGFTPISNGTFRCDVTYPDNQAFITKHNLSKKNKKVFDINEKW